MRGGTRSRHFWGLLIAFTFPPRDLSDQDCAKRRTARRLGRLISEPGRLGRLSGQLRDDGSSPVLKQRCFLFTKSKFPRVDRDMLLPALLKLRSASPPGPPGVRNRPPLRLSCGRAGLCSREPPALVGDAAAGSSPSGSFALL